MAQHNAATVSNARASTDHAVCQQSLRRSRCYGFGVKPQRGRRVRREGTLPQGPFGCAEEFHGDRSPFEAPEASEIVIDTQKGPADEATNPIVDWILKH